MNRQQKEDLLVRNSLILLGFAALGAFMVICAIVVALMATNFNPLGWME